MAINQARNYMTYSLTRDISAIGKHARKDSRGRDGEAVARRGFVGQCSDGVVTICGTTLTRTQRKHESDNEGYSGCKGEALGIEGHVEGFSMAL